LTSKPVTVAWFRQDLRISDNPALNAAAAAGDVLPIYILDDVNAADWAMGSASRAWLHHSLNALNLALRRT
jgi:deoxyribodipyrimidine photo-lyase